MGCPAPASQTTRGVTGGVPPAGPALGPTRGRNWIRPPPGQARSAPGRAEGTAPRPHCVAGPRPPTRSLPSPTGRPRPHRSGNSPRPGRRNRPRSSPWRSEPDPPPRAPAHVITPRPRRQTPPARAAGSAGGGGEGRGDRHCCVPAVLPPARGIPARHQLPPADPSCSLDYLL